MIDLILGVNIGINISKKMNKQNYQSKKQDLTTKLVILKNLLTNNHTCYGC